VAPVSVNATFDVAGVVATLPALALGFDEVDFEPQAAATKTSGTAINNVRQRVFTRAPFLYRSFASF
jgi:hypothetical protein